MPHNESLNWYEDSLAPQERKIRGHFSTPPLLVNRILDACGYTADADLSRLRVLDPACGSGNFLAGAVLRMLASGKQRGLEPRHVLASLQRNIWGFDSDPVACFLAEMQVHTLLQEQGIEGITHRKGDKYPYRLHIHQADGLTLPWEQKRREHVDLFLANPPYLAAKNADLSGYRSAQGLGQVDSYLLFLRLALQVVRPDGWIGLVLPDPVLARANATRERQRLLEETTVHHLWHLANVFPAYVGAAVIIAQKRPPQRVHQIAWVREKWGTRETISTHRGQGVSVPSIAQTLLLSQPGAELRYLLNDEHDTLVNRLHRTIAKADGVHNFVPLNHFVSIRRGEELGKKSVLLTHTLPDEQGWHPLLRGGVDVRPYGTPQGHCWIAEAAIGKPLARYRAPKLLVVKSTNMLQAALDTQGYVALQTLYLLTLNGDTEVELQRHTSDTLYFLLAILNSRLMQRYVYVLHTAYKLVQPQIEQHVLARLPIPVVAVQERREIIERAKKIVVACSNASSVVELKQQITLLCDEQERAICALYENAISM